MNNSWRNNGSAPATAPSIEDLIKGWESVPLQQAYDELHREMTVREKCFGKWIVEGRIGQGEAEVRLRGMAKAARIIAALLEADEAVVNTLLKDVPF